jgi:hypothetical protein
VTVRSGFIGGFNPLDQDPIEYSGKWGLKEQIQAIAAGRWTGIPTFELYAWGRNAYGQLGLATLLAALALFRWALLPTGLSFLQRVTRTLWP